MDTLDNKAITSGQLLNADNWLSGVIKMTRGCHIEAEKRLLSDAALVSRANLYYGCWSAVLTLLTLFPDYNFLALPAACFATVVALWAAYASVEKYELRARDFYTSYLELQKIWIRAEEAEKMPVGKERDSRIRKILEDYYQVLASTENHTSADYRCYLYGKRTKLEGGNQDSANSISLWWSYWLRWVFRMVLVPTFVYIVLPVMLLHLPRIVLFLHSL